MGFDQVVQRITAIVNPIGAGATPDGSDRVRRGDKYGNAFCLPAGLTPAQGGALSGNYFRGANATPGTEITTHANQTAYDQNLPIAVFRNTSSSRIMVPDFLAVKAETVLGSATRLLYTVSGSLTDDVSVSGTVLTAKNARLGDTNTAQGALHFGVPELTDVTKVILANGMFSDVVPVIDSNFVLRFGSPFEGSYISGAATAAHAVRDAGAVALMPGATLGIYLYGDSGSASPTYEVFGGWYEF